MSDNRSEHSSQDTFHTVPSQHSIDQNQQAADTTATTTLANEFIDSANNLNIAIQIFFDTF